MTGKLDRAHGEWLGSLAATVRTAKATEQLAAIRILLEEGAWLNSSHARAALEPLRDALALQLRGMSSTGDLETNLQIARKLQLTAGPGSPLDARVSEIEAQVTSLIARMTESDPDTVYLRDQLRSFYGLAPAPAHPRPIQARWRLAAAASSCDDMIAATRELLTSNSGSDEIAASVDVTRCAQTEQRATRREDKTWWEFYGYGVNLKISGDVRSLALELRRLERRDNAVPEVWIGEARWAKQWWFVGARVEAYRELLASDPAPGPWIVGLTIGALWSAQDTKVGQFVGSGSHTR